MGNLKNIKVGFGTASSPTVLSKDDILTIIRSIEDTQLTASYSGHVKLNSPDSINAAQKYVLQSAGVVYNGMVESVDFSLSADKTSLRETEHVTLTAVGSNISQRAFRYAVKTVTITGGSITSTALKNLCAFDGNVLTIGNSTMNERWTASIVVKAWVDTDEQNSKEITLSVTGIVNANDFVMSDIPSTINVENDGTTSQGVTITYSPTGCDTPASQPVVTSSDERISISNVTVSGFTMQVSADDDYTANVSVAAVGKTKSLSVNVHRKNIPTITIGGESAYDFFVEANEQYFGFSKTTSNVEVTLQSVVSSNSDITIKSYDAGGFTAKTTALTSDIATTFTATFLVDGKTVTVTKQVTFNRKFNRFSVYRNGAWLTNQDSVTIRVGNVQATYRMDGVWEVDNESVQAQADKYVYVDGVQYGEYGKGKYSDGSELVKTTFSNVTKKQFVGKGKILYYISVYKGSCVSGNVTVYDENEDATERIGVVSVNANQANYNDRYNYTMKNDYLAIENPIGGLKGYYDYQVDVAVFKNLPEDVTLTIPSSFKAINGDGEMTCNLVNTGNIPALITSIQSSNDAFVVTNNRTSFKCAVRNTTEDISTTLTITIKHGENTETITQDVSALWEEQEVAPPPYDKDTLDTLGVAIMDVDGNLYASAAEWTASGKSKNEAMGIAVSYNGLRFCINNKGLDLYTIRYAWILSTYNYYEIPKEYDKISDATKYMRRQFTTSEGTNSSSYTYIGIGRSFIDDLISIKFANGCQSFLPSFDMFNACHKKSNEIYSLWSYVCNETLGMDIYPVCIQKSSDTRTYKTCVNYASKDVTFAVWFSSEYGEMTTTILCENGRFYKRGDTNKNISNIFGFCEL